MALVTTATALAGSSTARGLISGGVRSVFGSSGNAAQLGREQKRQALQKVGFEWRKSSGVPDSERWNIDNWGDRALDNVGRLYDEYGQIAVDLHNSKKLSDAIASDWNALRALAVKNQTGGGGSNAWFGGGAVDSDVKIAGFGIVPILLVLSAVGGWFFFNK